MPYIYPDCDCDPIGSEHGGECESRTDPSHDLVAGRCLCKRFVEGRRCDTCKAGFWNMKAENHDGCERKILPCFMLHSLDKLEIVNRRKNCQCGISDVLHTRSLPSKYELSPLDPPPPCLVNVSSPTLLRP